MANPDAEFRHPGKQSLLALRHFRLRLRVRGGRAHGKLKLPRTYRGFWQSPRFHEADLAVRRPRRRRLRPHGAEVTDSRTGTGVREHKFKVCSRVRALTIMEEKVSGISNRRCWRMSQQRPRTKAHATKLFFIARVSLETSYSTNNLEWNRRRVAYSSTDSWEFCVHSNRWCKRVERGFSTVKAESRWVENSEKVRAWCSSKRVRNNSDIGPVSFDCATFKVNKSDQDPSSWQSSTSLKKSWTGKDPSNLGINDAKSGMAEWNVASYVWINTPINSVIVRFRTLGPWRHLKCCQNNHIYCILSQKQHRKFKMKPTWA